uniref:Uncharacterized protein n=1 Tax=Romanomermis culicivorax TaxID=13658 RepID=A0A915ISN1_ROMCU
MEPMFSIMWCLRRATASTKMQDFKLQVSRLQGVKRQYQRCSFASCPSDVLCSETQVVDKQCADNSEKICANFQDVTFKCTFPSCCEPYRLANGSCLLLRQKPDDASHHRINGKLDNQNIAGKSRWSTENDDDANDIDSDVFKLPKWGLWGEWSNCVGAVCGGCALRARIRACLSESCK